MDAITLADYVISVFEKENATVTNLKLQKVLYYVQGYFFRCFRQPAYEEDTYGWQYGPVVPAVYYHFASCHASRLSSTPRGQALVLTDEAQRVIDTVVRQCAKMSTSALVTKTHEETPWQSASVGGIITMASIQRYFLTHDPLGLGL